MISPAVGKFVKLSDFLRWVRQQGCTYTSGVTGDNRLFKVIRPPQPSPKYVIIIDVADDESLPEHDFTYYARRLGLAYP